MHIQWEDPPEKYSRKGKVELPTNVLNILRANPERWALIEKDISYARAASWSDKYRKLYPDYQFRITKGATPKSGLVYGRFIGDGSK